MQDPGEKWPSWTTDLGALAQVLAPDELRLSAFVSISQKIQPALVGRSREYFMMRTSNVRKHRQPRQLPRWLPVAGSYS